MHRLSDLLSCVLFLHISAHSTTRPTCLSAFTQKVCTKLMESKSAAYCRSLKRNSLQAPVVSTAQSIEPVPQSQGPSEKQKTQAEPLSCKGPWPNSNLNQFHLIRCHGIHYIIIIPLTQGWIFNECNCRQMVGHNCVKWNTAQVQNMGVNFFLFSFFSSLFADKDFASS